MFPSLTPIFLPPPLPTLDKEPELKSVRCVPQSWCQPSKVVPVKVWDDTGAGGGKAGSVWIINSMDMIAVVAGHDPPKDEAWELRSTKLHLEGLSLTMRGLA